MAWLHTWSGLIVGWVLYFVFVTGTAGYVDDEITRWMQPELPKPVLQVSEDRNALITHGLNYLVQHAPHAKSWTITLPHEQLHPREIRSLSVAWEDVNAPRQANAGNHSEDLDLNGQVLIKPEVRDTRGGQGLYQMHYALHYMSRTTAFNIVAVCTMLMLLAVITGIITHKKIFTDFFTFRPRKGQRSWMDAHIVMSVMSLPFFLMITYTGLIFFLFVSTPLPQTVLFGDVATARATLFQEIFQEPKREYEKLTLPETPLIHFVQQAEQQWGVGETAQLRLEHRQGASPFVDIKRIHRDSLIVNHADTLRFDLQTGLPIGLDPPKPTAANIYHSVLSLHEGGFANWWLRGLYFISGLLGCGVIATGLILWTVKRKAQHHKHPPALLDKKGMQLVEILNIGTIVGLPMSIAVYFLANRLLPIDLAQRAAWEFNALFITWGWALLYAATRSPTTAWIGLLRLSALIYGAVPIVNALTTDKHLAYSLMAQDWAIAGVDISMLVFALLSGYLANTLHRRWRQAARNASVTSTSSAEKNKHAVI